MSNASEHGRPGCAAGGRLACRSETRRDARLPHRPEACAPANFDITIKI